MKEYRMKGSPA